MTHLDVVLRRIDREPRIRYWAEAAMTVALTGARWGSLLFIGVAILLTVGMLIP